MIENKESLCEHDFISIGYRCLKCDLETSSYFEEDLEQKIKDRIQILKQKEHLTYINESIPSWIIINELEYLLND